MERDGIVGVGGGSGMANVTLFSIRVRGGGRGAQTVEQGSVFVGGGGRSEVVNSL